MSSSEKILRAKKIDVMAEELAKRVKAEPSSMKFIYKACWKLSEARLWSNAEAASNARNSMGLFIFLCKKDGV